MFVFNEPHWIAKRTVRRMVFEELEIRNSKRSDFRTLLWTIYLFENAKLSLSPNSIWINNSCKNCVCWSIDKMVGWLSIYWVVLERLPSQHTQLNAIRINTVTENLDHFPNSLVQMWNRERERICCSFEFVCYFSVCNL